MKRLALMIVACAAMYFQPNSAPAQVEPYGATAIGYNANFAPRYKKRYTVRKHRYAKRYARSYRTARYSRQMAKRPSGNNIFARYARSGGAGCLTGPTRAILSELQSRFSVSIVGTCANRNIAGTNRKSYHAYGMAVDFNVPAGQKQAAVNFLKTKPVLVMTYFNMGHIHFNTGQKGVILAANANGGGGRYYSARRKTNVQYAKRWRARYARAH